MRNLLIDFIIKIPKETQNSVYKPVNATSSEVIHHIKNKLSEKVKHTAAYLAFEKSCIEFINNSHDAGATRFRVRFLQHTDSIEIEIMDNGRGLPAEKETTRYDWKKAILTVSDKADEAKASGKKSCGQHLALSTTAYALERQDGHLAITNRENTRGALVKIVSPLTACNSDEFLEPKPGKGRNLIDEMLLVALEKDEDAIHQIRRISSSPDFTGTRKRAAQSVLTRIATPSDDAACNESSPILTTPMIFSLASPDALRARIRLNSSSFPCQTPLNTPASTMVSTSSSSISFFSPKKTDDAISALLSSDHDAAANNNGDHQRQ